jgi:hypothetical protein
MLVGLNGYMRRYRWAIAASVAISALAISILAVRALASDLARPRDLHRTLYAQSGECRRCHPSHYESWARTFHRTMTQEASEASVLGDFDGASISYGGIRAVMQRADGRFVMRFVGPDGLLSRAEVARTVGSRRIQQYLARDGDVYFRLPVAWNVEEGRWMHMNGAFLTPDPTRSPTLGRIELADYHRHVTRWNDNCVFCHNVAPDPGLREQHFDTRVAELGVACGACHGPGEEHVRVNRDPLRRYALHLSDRRDPTIVNPSRLSPQRSAEVCGRCHGQRITDDFGRFLSHGDRFVPGERLRDYSRPLSRDTPLHGDRTVFAPRFWRDGTARLTAYEYQGLLASPCRGLTCIDCHSMHEGDPRGQIAPSAIGDHACTGCHRELAQAAAARAHSAHSARVECVECHMPRIVYGLVHVHRSHRIEIPDPARDAANGRPDACTLCHAERTLAWAQHAFDRLWRDSPSAVRAREDEAHVPTMALAGDPIERAVACAALGRADALNERDRPRRLGLLLDTMIEDPYPAIRRIAWQSARSLARGTLEWGSYDPTADRAARVAWVERARGALGDPPMPASASLRATAAQAAIEIGE